MRDGKFREDLYYRLSMVELRVPGLAERKEDLPLLIRHFIQKFAEQFNKPVTGLTRRASIALSRYDWPGNVRELENAIGHACMMTMGSTIDVTDLPEYLRGDGSRLADAPGSAPSSAMDDSVLEDSEKRLVADALAKASGNQSEAARLLRIGRDALRYKMKKYGLGQ
jgi:DNA-binding NtrC family response regulator